MALYERFVDGKKVARAFTVDGSDHDAELRALVGSQGWKHVPDRPEKPARNASTDAWRAYAVAMGMDEEEAAQYSRDELAAHYSEDG